MNVAAVFVSYVRKHNYRLNVTENTWPSFYEVLQDTVSQINKIINELHVALWQIIAL